ncbi:hypothetical protein BGZ49_001112 [Haplosporangium sp. Z 27]|nr:hypothetical protein BGZ49_001112 [Haplosporangium sp. Z 27]
MLLDYANEARSDRFISNETIKKSYPNIQSEIAKFVNAVEEIIVSALFGSERASDDEKRSLIHEFALASGPRSAFDLGEPLSNYEWDVGRLKFLLKIISIFDEFSPALQLQLYPTHGVLAQESILSKIVDSVDVIGLREFGPPKQFAKLQIDMVGLVLAQSELWSMIAEDWWSCVSERLGQEFTMIQVQVLVELLLSLPTGKASQKVGNLIACLAPLLNEEAQSIFTTSLISIFDSKLHQNVQTLLTNFPYECLSSSNLDLLVNRCTDGWRESCEFLSDERLVLEAFYTMHQYVACLASIFSKSEHRHTISDDARVTLIGWSVEIIGGAHELLMLIKDDQKALDKISRTIEDLFAFLQSMQPLPCSQLINVLDTVVSWESLPREQQPLSRLSIAKFLSSCSSVEIPEDSYMIKMKTLFRSLFDNLLRDKEWVVIHGGLMSLAEFCKNTPHLGIAEACISSSFRDTIRKMIEQGKEGLGLTLEDTPLFWAMIGAKMINSQTRRFNGGTILDLQETSRMRPSSQACVSALSTLARYLETLDDDRQDEGILRRVLNALSGFVMNLDDVIEQNRGNNSSGQQALSNGMSQASQGWEPNNLVLLESGYVSAGFMDDDSRIFTLARVDYQIPSRLSAMAVSNNILFMAMDTMHLLRIDLDKAHEVEDIEIPRKPSEGRIYKMFFDPTGRHLIITTETGDNYYLFAKWKKAKLLSKFRGIVIESIAWNRSIDRPTESSTKEFLIGTRNGLIFEAELEPTAELFKKEERYFKQVYAMEPSMPICGLRMEQFPASLRKYVVVAVTPTRIYQFIGSVTPANTTGIIGGSEDRALFESLFTKYGVKPEFSELPGDLRYSELHFFSPYQDLQYQGVAKTFAWLTGPGIYHGNLVFGSQNDSVIDSPHLLPYPATRLDMDVSAFSEVPISIALTEFHFILLYKERIRAINQLNDQIVFDELIPLKAKEEVLGMSVDTTKNTFWIYTGSSLFELVITKEDRDVWTLYLEQKKYDMALHYTKNASQRDRVLTLQADHNFSQGLYMLSAKYYAQSAVPFEEVALKFVERDSRDALRSYLLAKLDKLKKGDITQKTIISTWLVEIYLSKLNQLEDQAASCAPDSDVQNLQAEQDVLKDEFKAFLETNKMYLDKKTTYKLLASHGRTEQLLYYAILIGDYERVLSHWVQEKNYKNALDVLIKQESLDTYYRFSPVLMENAPYETVSAWMRQPNLNPRNLIPSLLKYDHSKMEAGAQNQAIRYLSYVVMQLGNTDPAIHNYLLTLYATQPTKDESALLTFLATEGQAMHYNLDYALRICTQNNRIQSCVNIFSSMGHYGEAVDLALKHNDLELARINADKPEDDEMLRKTLWLKIARHVVKEKKDIKAAMEFLSNSDLLKIEDILPFFPDFVLIDDFKEEICKALEEYNIHIDELKMDMDEATKSAENIRIDVRELRSRFAVVASTERCTACDYPLLTRQFYIFPCQHTFHADCLIKNLTPFLTSRQMKRMVELEEQIQLEMQNQQKMVVMNGNHTLQPLTVANRAEGGGGGLGHLPNQLIGQTGAAVMALGGALGAGGKAMVNGGVAIAATAAGTAAGVLKDVIFAEGKEAGLGLGIRGAGGVGGGGGGLGGDDMAVVVPRLELLRDEMDDLVASECLLCGELMIKTIDQPFLTSDEHELELSWGVQ